MKLRTIKYYLNKLIDWIYFGKITQKVKGYEGGMISEIEFRGRNNKIIGYWAYGYYDHELPYPRGKK